ncbi:hypothetical protein [Rickettsia endosymbiont of Orchestes rusci]
MWLPEPSLRGGIYADVAIQKIYSHPELVSGSFTRDAEINSA